LQLRCNPVAEVGDAVAVGGFDENRVATRCNPVAEVGDAVAVGGFDEPAALLS
jgi:hypothetical protein